jgi:ribose transport system substrate-binding protein
MKKSIIFIFLSLVITVGAFANGQTETAVKDDGIMKVGLTVQDLTNQVWASRAIALEKVIEANGGEFTYVGCSSNATTQISQIENLVSSGIDILMVHPAEKSSIDSELKFIKSSNPDLKVFVYDEELENADMCFLADNYDCGYMIGTTAAEWINEKLDGTTEVAVIGWPQIEVLLERENGIKDAIKDLAPNAKIVATGAAINNVDGMALAENFLQANPNIKVIASIGGNSSVGANEAVKAAGKLTPDFGIFASDATDGELAAMANNEACRSSIMYTGTSDEVAVIIYDWLTQLYTNGSYEKNVYHTFVPVNASNYKKYI